MKNKEDSKKHYIKTIQFCPKQNLESNETIEYWNSLANHKNLARDLANGRSDKVTPQEFIKKAKRLKAKHPEIKLTIFEDEELLEQGMNLNYAVGQGSANRPAFVNMTYKGNPKSGYYHAIIGKGVTFDTGGYNLKPTNFMEEMFMDKGGASVTFAAFKFIVENKIDVNVTCSIPLAENFVSSNAYRPSDIIQSLSGLNVEVTNTDAEGRLIMCDAMTWTQRRFEKLSSMVELSTLTGACLVALGDRHAGLFSNDDTLANILLDSAKSVGEDMWRLPIYPHIKEGLKGKHSDIVNSSKSRYGGAIEAAAYLSYFVEEGVKWAHIDIAGPAHTTTPFGVYENGCTGYGVGLLVDFLKKTRKI